MVQLQLGDDGRFVVDDEELHAGDVVELALDGGNWARVRFEWEHVQGGRPTGYFVLSLDGGHEAMLRAPVGATLRWPEHSSR